MSGHKVEICGVNTSKLPLLTTEDKDSIVGAINELVSSLGDLNSVIGDLADLTTEDKTALLTLSTSLFLLLLIPIPEYQTVLLALKISALKETALLTTPPQFKTLLTIVSLFTSQLVVT